MAETQEGTRKCSECGETIRAAALMCRFCGTTFEPRRSLKEAVGATPPSTPDFPLPATAQTSTPIKKPGIWPLVLVGVVMLGLVVLIAPCVSQPKGDPAQRVDAEFEDHVRKSFTQNGFAGAINAIDGVCTITLEEDMPPNLAGPLARITAGTYAYKRKAAGLDPESTVTIYANGIKVAEETTDSAGMGDMFDAVRQMGRSGQ